MEGKKSFVIYVSWKLWLDALDDRQTGQWLKWMLAYTNDLNPPYPEDKAVEIACRMAQDTLKRDLKKYNDRVERIKAARNQNPNNNKDISKDNDKTDIKLKSDNNQSNISSVNVNVNDNVNVNVNDNVNNNIILKENSIKEKSAPSRFIPPTLEEIIFYCSERNNLVDPERFYNFYQAKGWMVGKNKMKDWKAAVRTWEKEAGFKSNENTKDEIVEINGKKYDKSTGLEIL